VKPVVLDASALLAAMLGEPGAEKVVPFLPGAAISTVNLSEAIGKLLAIRNQPDELAADIQSLGLDIRPFDTRAAFLAGRLLGPTRHLGLSQGDRACLALAHSLRRPALTANPSWSAIDSAIATIEIIR
jgi:ribonuclease VapC